MAAAARGCSIANHTTAKTVTSSARLTPMLVTGSGEVLIASRRPALTEVRQQRRAAADDRRDGLVEGVGLAGQQHADHGARRSAG